MTTSPPEPVGINPRIDCVFKAILGDPARSHILLDFLNAVLEPETPIVSVTILNPFHPPDFIGDDFRVVDVLAVDAAGQIFHVEMQTANDATLRARMLYMWASLYSGEIQAGGQFDELRPVISVWLMDRPLLKESPAFHHRFTVHDPRRGVDLCDHLQLHTFELSKWRAGGAAGLALTRWMSFFSGAEQWTEVPPELRHPALEDAMSVLEQFKRNADWSMVYFTRRMSELRRATIEHELAELALVKAAAERAQMERAQAEAERAQAETALVEERTRAEQLLARLRAAGLEP